MRCLGHYLAIHIHIQTHDGRCCFLYLATFICYIRVIFFAFWNVGLSQQGSDITRYVKLRIGRLAMARQAKNITHSKHD